MDPTCSPLRKSIAGWLGHLEAQGRSPKTRQLYGQAVGRLGRFLEARGRHRPCEVTAEDLAAWHAGLQATALAPASLAVYVRAVRRWSHWLAEQGEVFLAPARDLREPRVPRPLPMVPSVGEVARLLGAPNTGTPAGIRDRAILETLYATAMRRAEAVQIKLGDVELNARTLQVVGKGGRERTLPLTTPAAEWLARYLATGRPALDQNRGGEALWLDGRGHRLSSHGLALLVKRHVRAAGLDGITPHSLRRACATHLLANGAHPGQLQLLLGHASLRHLSQYLRLGLREIQAFHARSRLGQ